MGPGLGRALACTLLLLCQWPIYADSKCCEKKVVPGLSSKAGTYNLVPHSDPVPGFCLGGCVYTKEGDPLPGTNYCFKEGDMNYTCSGGGCGGNVEGWIEKYFQKECSMQINSVLKIVLQKQYSSQQQCGWSNNFISNVSVEVYDKPACEGAPVQEGMSGSTYYNSEAFFLIKVADTKPWSVFVSKEGFKSECQDIGMMVPFTTNYEYIYMVEDTSESELLSSVSLNFTFDINNELLTDVFVQGNPTSCLTFPFFPPFGKGQTKNKSKPKSKPNSEYDFFVKRPAMVNRQGSGSGGGGGYNYKCSPTCRYASWNTDPSITPCACKGVIGGGLHFSDISLPNQQTPEGAANMSGSLFWYNDTSFQGPFQLFTAFAEFKRRNSSSVRVCDSNLVISLQSKISPRTLQKKIPCFSPQIPPTIPKPTYPTYPTVPIPGGSGFPGLPTLSPGISDGSLDNGLTTSPPITPESPGSGSGVPGAWPTSYPQWLTTTSNEDQFSEVDGVLIWGKGDRFWIVGCMPLDNVDRFLPLEVDFFTAKDPKDTPEFCGCLLLSMTMQGNIETTEATKEQVKECYVVALKGGPSPTNIGRKKKMTKKKGKKLQKYHEKKWKNKDKKLHKRFKKLERLNRQQKTAKSMKKLKKFVRKMKAKKPKLMTGRSKRDVTDEEFYKDGFEEEEFDENMFNEEELAEDGISMDFGNRFDFEEYGDTYDESEEQDYDYEDDSLSSDW